MSFDHFDSHADGRILSAVEGACGRLVLNNPERRNALSRAMFEAGGDVVAAMAEDPAVRLLVIEGAGGRAFAAGADISRFDEERATPEDVRAYQASTERFYGGLARFPKPTIAKIHGYCIGGGLALALNCDMRIAEDGARFAIPAARLGLGYGHDGVRTLIALVGPSVAMEIFATARQFTAAEARDMGLINHVSAPGDLDAYVADYARRIAENAPMTIAAVKAAVLARTPEEEAAVDRMVAACFASDDYAEGRRAFLEKRSPRFRGR